MAQANGTLVTSTTAALIGTPRGGRRFLAILNPASSGASVYIGGSNVSSSNAVFTLAEGDDPLIISTALGDSLAGEEWYARAASGTPTIRYQEG